MSRSARGEPAPATGAGQLVLRGPRLADGRTVDVALADGRVTAVAPAGSLRPRAPGDLVALDGYLLLPAPAEPHAHPETALTARDAAPRRPLPTRVAEAALIQLGHGATAQRCHVAIDEGLEAWVSVLEAGRALAGLAEVSAVPLPGPLTGRAGADQRALLREAVAMGAGAVGGAPDRDPDPAGHLDAVLELADELRLPVALHTEAAEPAWLARLVAAAGDGGRALCLGPAGGLARLARPVLRRVAEGLAAGGVRVVCVPRGGCGARAFGPAPVRELTAAGVTVAAGSGALRSATDPVGGGDPLRAAFLLATRGERTPAAAWAAVGPLARAALGLPAPARVAVGSPAELLAVRGGSVAEALSLGYSRVVFHRGRIVARTSAVREYAADGPTAAGLELPRQQPG
ncbi:cytosine deaminase [Streptomyces zhaozhouensis]|uniref:Cytosine deaminase n=1 Tax=Streptomyces zhaozhouensis TaxID=1300267 RepID=A0A286DT52_9ACTN|nr:hydrolase [Streptomyces zhaozhouensis]SOD61856.1 cytosine deaminase [Streptomyces zhaozhouensis]